MTQQIIKLKEATDMNSLTKAVVFFFFFLWLELFLSVDLSDASYIFHI